MPTLEIITGKSAGQKIDVAPTEAEVTFGNRRTATVVLKDPWITFMHAVITKKDGAYWVSDKRSRAGTTVNGQKVDERGRALKDGDTISLGKTEIKFHDAAKAAAPAAAPSAPASRGSEASSPFSAPVASNGPFSPFTPHAAPASAGAATATSSAAAEDLRRAQADLQSLRTALASRDKALAEAQAKLRALEGKGQGTDKLHAQAAQLAQEAEAAQAEAAAALERAVKAESDLVQLRQQHEETVSKAKIRIEEAARLTQTLEARLRAAGAGAAVDQERELSQVREELRRVREAGRARLDQLTQENAALKAKLEQPAVVAAPVVDAARVTELEGLVAEAERSCAVMQKRAEDLEARLDAKETELEALRAERAPPPPVSSQENAALEQAITDLNRELEESRAETERLRAQLESATEGNRGAATRQEVTAPAPEAPASDANAAQLEAACEALRRERDEAREEAQLLRKDLEDINEDMLAQEEEYQQRIAELEAKLGGES